jgi:hypothetical protein
MKQRAELHFGLTSNILSNLHRGRIDCPIFEYLDFRNWILVKFLPRLKAQVLLLSLPAFRISGRLSTA